MLMNNLYDDTSALHWLTKYDPDDGEPYGTQCQCEIGDDHDNNGRLTP
jgi:hypothetical protein